MSSSRTASKRFLWMWLTAGLALAIGAERASGGELVAVSESEAFDPADADALPWRIFAVSSDKSDFSAGASSLRVRLAAGDHASCARSVELDGPVGILCRFNLSLSGVSGGEATEQVLRVGSGFGNSNVDEADVNTYARLGIKAADSGRGFQLRDLVARRNSPGFEGTQAVTWALNPTGRGLSYAAPDGTIEPIASDHMDVWVGRTKVFDEMVVTRSTAALSELKWYWGAGSGSTSFDHLDIVPLEDGVAETPVPDPAPVAGTSPAIAPASQESSLELYRPAPNPFERTTRFAYAIPGGSERVEIGVFDVAGRQIRNLIREVQSAGRYEVAWDGRNATGDHVRNGVYFLRATIGQDLRVARIAYLVK